VQGPSPFDAELLERMPDVRARRLDEEGEEGMLAADDWAVYNDLDEIDDFLAWLNPKGVRELALKNAFTKWWPHIAPGVRRRAADLNVNVKLSETRRSSRTKATGAEMLREPYMIWTNRKAVNGA